VLHRRIPHRLVAVAPLALAGGLAVATCTPRAATPANPVPPPDSTAIARAPRAAASPLPTAPEGRAGAGGVGGAKAPGLAPLSADEPLVELEVAEHGNAVVSLPLGATERRGVVVATHGNYDRPDWTCAIWRSIVKLDGFVLCPRGVVRGDSRFPGDRRFHYLSNRHLEREIEAALAALADRYPDYVASPPHVFAGFSQGAIMGVPIIGRRPEWFDRAILIEGGFDRWSKGQVEAFAAAGGKRVLFACGQWACDHGGRTAGKWFEASGIESRVLFAKGAGHTYGGEIAELVAGAWRWVVAQDERWTAGSQPETPGD
jgi:predicted esterase